MRHHSTYEDAPCQEDQRYLGTARNQTLARDSSRCDRKMLKQRFMYFYVVLVFRSMTSALPRKELDR